MRWSLQNSMMQKRKQEEVRLEQETVPRRSVLTISRSRVTDHRIKLTLHRLENILNGDLDEVIDSLIAADQAAKLSNLQEEE